MRYLLYPHGGASNHGCEAIVRSTVTLIGGIPVIATSDPEEDRIYGLDACCELIKDSSSLDKVSPRFVWSYVKRRFFGDEGALDKLAFKPLFDAAKACDMALSIGGDNYCYGDNRFLYLIDRELHRLGVKTALWGCSIEPMSLKGELLADLKGFDRIIARESLTYEALKSKNIFPVDLFPDPAFALGRKESILPDGFEDGNTVGINVSPLALGYERHDGVIMQNYIGLINHILNYSDMKVALIPHVVRKYEDDRVPLGQLYEIFKDSDRVVMVQDRPAEELKYIIGKCRFMIAARTHASIAAYSSLVPTLVVGYSIKSEGIATDIFGTAEHYVLPVRSLRGDGDDLLEGFKWLMSHENAVKEHLTSFIPDYVGRLDKLKLC